MNVEVYPARAIGVAIASGIVTLLPYRLLPFLALPAVLLVFTVAYGTLPLIFSIRAAGWFVFMVNSAVTILTAAAIGITIWVRGDAHEVGIVGAALEGILLHAMPALVGVMLATALSVLIRLHPSMHGHP